MSVALSSPAGVSSSLSGLASAAPSCSDQRHVEVGLKGWRRAVVGGLTTENEWPDCHKRDDERRQMVNGERIMVREPGGLFS